MKRSQITYSVVYNKTKQKVDFHGKLTYPLYVEMIFNREHRRYKSSLFTQFLQPKYGIRIAGELHPPKLELIVDHETKLVEFVIDKNLENFSLEVFKKEYEFNSKDILNLMEPNFFAYFYTFLQDEGLPYLAETIRATAIEKNVNMFNLFEDQRIAWKEKLYNRLLEHAFYYGPPYLPLSRFIQEYPLLPLKCMTVMDWNTETVKSAFSEFLTKNYPVADPIKMSEGIDRYIETLKG